MLLWVHIFPSFISDGISTIPEAGGSLWYHWKIRVVLGFRRLCPSHLDKGGCSASLDSVRMEYGNSFGWLVGTFMSKSYTCNYPPPGRTTRTYELRELGQFGDL
jgi:hypothetical protein